MPRGRKGAPRNPVTGRFISVDQAIAQAVAWYNKDSPISTPDVSKPVSPKAFAEELSVKSKQDEWVEGVTRSACERIVAQAQRNVLKTAPIHNSGAQKYIDYDVEWRGSEMVGTVGYNKAKGGAAHLGNLLEFGGGGDPSPAHWDIARALDAESDRYYNKLGDAAEAILESRWGELREV